MALWRMNGKVDVVYDALGNRILGTFSLLVELGVKDTGFDDQLNQRMVVHRSQRVGCYHRYKSRPKSAE
jgi:hypothetical protein